MLHEPLANNNNNNNKNKETKTNKEEGSTSKGVACKCVSETVREATNT